MLDDLAGVVRAVHNGAQPLSDDVRRILATRLNYGQLTAREVEVLELIAQGLSNKEVGKALGITEETTRCTCGTSWRSWTCRTGPKR